MSGIILSYSNYKDAEAAAADIHLLLNNDISKLTTNSKGHLVKKNCFQRLTYFLHIKRHATDLSLFKRVNKIVSDIKDELKKPKPNENTISSLCVGTKEELNKSHVMGLIINKYAQLKVKPKEDTLALFDKDFQNYVSPELYHLRSEKAQNPSLKQNKEHKLKRIEAKTRLISRIGLGVKNNKGSTGTVIVKFFSTKKRKLRPIAIFKPSNSHVHWTTYIKNFFKKSFFGQLAYLKKDAMAQPHAEMVAYLFDQKFSLNLAPPTKCTEIGPHQGAVQLFSRGKQEFSKVVKEFDSQENYEKEEIQTFQETAVFDYAIGNLDRHEENLFIRENQKQFKGVVPIDNANSFPVKAPDGLAAKFLHNQYKWRELKIAGEKFTPKTIDLIRSLTEEKIDEFIQEINYSIPNFFNQEMINLFKMRMAILRKVVTPENTPRDLGNIRTLTAMQGVAAA